MFSQTVEYALRAAVHLAIKSPAAQTTAEIAEATKVPLAYLSKVLQGLREKTDRPSSAWDWWRSVARETTD